MNVDRRTALVHALDTPTTELGGHCHGRMLRVYFLNHGSNVIYSRPDSRTVARLIAFHLIAYTPEQYGRMVFVTQHNLASALELRGYLRVLSL